MSEALTELSSHLSEARGSLIAATQLNPGELGVRRRRAKTIVRAAGVPARRRASAGFVYLIGHLRRRLAAARKAFRRCVSSVVAEAEPAHPREGRRPTRMTPVPSARAVYPGADWFEREAYGPLRRSVLRPSGSSPHPDRLRLRRTSAAQGLPARPASSRSATTMRQSGWSTNRWS